MTELRWILIGFGIVLLAGIYLWGRRGAAAVADDALRPRSEPAPQPHAFADVRRESAAAPDEIPDYDADEPPARAAASTRPDDFEVTAARPAASVRSEPRSFNTDTLRSFGKEPASAAVSEARPVSPPDFRRGRVEPTFGSNAATEELPVHSLSAAASASPAPTLSSSDTPSLRRTERRKILALRLTTAPQRLEGAKLLEILQSELLEHGKYEVFHRLHSDGSSIFSVASMVEPGTFDLEKMGETLYPGITLFAQLPNPVPGMHALNELVACARRLQQSLGGVLQDDRGVPLTVHRIERMRQEVREFERPPSAGGRPARGEPVRREDYQE
jgi:cell division protein ZipA